MDSTDNPTIAGSTTSTMYFPTSSDKVTASKALEKEMEHAILDIVAADTYEKLVIAHAKFNANREVASKMRFGKQSFKASVILEDVK